MSSLYLDTTSCLCLGLLDSKYNWIDYQRFESKKNSSILFPSIDDLLKKNGLEVSNLKEVIYAAGPGSYTGMRLSDGLGQIISWLGVKTYSFYHYDVPKILGVKAGSWGQNAFKGEVFLHHWDKDGTKQELVTEIKTHSPLYSLESEIGETKAISTIELIKNSAESFFKYVVDNNLNREVFYFRPEEKEFKVTQEG